VRPPRARALRDQVLADGGDLEVGREQLLERLGPPPLPDATPAERDEAAAAYAQALLTQDGLVADPPATRAPAGTAVRLRPSSRLAFQGVAAVTLLAAVVAAAAHWSYGLALLVGGAVACWPLARRPDLVARLVPRWVPRGRALGVAVALPALLAAACLLAFPLWLARSSGGGDEAAATARLREATANIQAGNLTAAQSLLGQAERLAPDVPDLEAVRAELVVARVAALLSERDRQAGVFDEAERAAARGDHDRAIALMTSVRGFRNAEERLRAYRAAQRRAGDR